MANSGSGILFLSIVFILTIIVGISIILYSHINYKKGAISKSNSTKLYAIGGSMIGISFVFLIAYSQF
jgi:hypothetical protein